MPPTPGQIVILNGVPRAGKSSIARVLQRRRGAMMFGVDATMVATPENLLPGIGLRPGGERPDLEAFVAQSYAALFDALAAFSRNGLDVVSDVGLHDTYSRPLGIVATAREKLAAAPVLWVGVHCPIDVVMQRRNADTTGLYAGGAEVPAPVQRWQDTVHAGMHYDLEVDTGAQTPEQCADQIEAALARIGNTPK